MTKSLSDFLQVWGFEEDYIIFADGTFGFVLVLCPLDPSCWSDSRMNEFSAMVRQFLNGLPEGIDIQFIQDVESGSAQILAAHSNYKTDCDNKTVAALTETRIERFSTLDQMGSLPRHSLKLAVRRAVKTGLVEKPRLFGKTKNYQAISDERLREELGLTERLKSDLMSSLSQLGISARSLSSDEIAGALYSQWNPTRSLDLKGYDPDDVRHSILFSDVGVSERGFSIGGMHYRVVSLKLLPDQTFSTMASALRDLPFGSRLQLTVHSPNQQKELERLQLQRRVAYSMISGRQSGVSDLDSEAKFKDLEGLLEQMVAQGEKVFHFSLQIVVRAASSEVLDDYVTQALMKIRELSGAEGFEESLAAFSIFSEIALPNARTRERVKAIKTSNLADLLPLYGPWSGHKEPKILLRSRYGNLIGFNPFSTTLTNSNQIVSGGSGSGKSFLTNLLLMQMLNENPKVFVVDIGGSYKKICDNFSGQYIPLGVESTFSINPFDLAEGDSVPSNSKIKFLVSLIEIMTKEEGESRLGRLERAEIESAIQKTYDTVKAPVLSDLRENLLRHTDPEIKRIGKILSPWCGNSPYGRFLDQKTSIQLSRKIVCFDLKGLESLPDLQAAALFIITDFVWREVQVDRTQMKFLIFDECWKLLENDSGATFIAEVFRTFRKYMASAIAISQNIDDFAQSKVANAILPNASIKWILKQKGADQDRLKEVLSLNENEVALISSIRQERGEYSEAFLMAEDQRSMVVIESTPLEYWLATTDPRDLARIEKEKRSDVGREDLEILKKLADLYPRGVAAGGAV
ncbi:MAG: ATP-binding protein [Bdellovibrionales bacterium]